MTLTGSGDLGGASTAARRLIASVGTITPAQAALPAAEGFIFVQVPPASPSASGSKVSLQAIITTARASDRSTARDKILQGLEALHSAGVRMEPVNDERIVPGVTNAPELAARASKRIGEALGAGAVTSITSVVPAFTEDFGFFQDPLGWSLARGRFDAEPALFLLLHCLAMCAVSRASVLIVDDEPAIRESLRMILEFEGYRVEEATNGLEALQKTRERPPGAILLDIRMPEMDGHETLKALRERGYEMPVLVLSGHANVATAVEATRRVAFDFFEKPLQRERVLLSLRNAVEAYRLQRESRQPAAGDGVDLIGTSPAMRRLRETLQPKGRHVLGVVKIPAIEDYG